MQVTTMSAYFEKFVFSEYMNERLVSEVIKQAEIGKWCKDD